MRPRPHLSPRRHTHLSEHQLSRREASVYVGDLAIPRLPRGTCYLLQTGGGGSEGLWEAAQQECLVQGAKVTPTQLQEWALTHSPVSIQGLRRAAAGGGDI